jgi:hypothetical protein
MVIVNANAEAVREAARGVKDAIMAIRKAKCDIRDNISLLKTHLGDKYCNNAENAAERIRKILDDAETKLLDCESRLIGLAEALDKY